MAILRFVITWVLGYISLASSVSPFESSERQLVNQLLSRYSQLGTVARPVLNTSSCVQVRFGLRLVHVDLDEKEQVMRTSVWIRMRWKDHLLTWNASAYKNVKSVVLPSDKVWVPDIALVNTATTEYTEHRAMLRVNRTGHVFWAPMRTYTSACLIDVTEYPYDRHTCEMWFQSMAISGSKMNITAYHVSPLDLDTYLSSYKDAQEWEIVSNETSWHKRPRDAGMILMWSRRAAQRFVLTLQRRPGFQAMLLIVPCTLLSLLIPVVFCIPPERPDRHALAMSLFGSLTILLFMVNDVAPSSSSFVPKLGLYYSFNLMVLLLATCCSTAVVNIHKRWETREEVPSVIRRIFIDCLGRCLGLGNRVKYLENVEDGIRKQGASQESDDGLKVQTLTPESYPTKQREEKLTKPDTVIVLDTRLRTLDHSVVTGTHAMTRESSPCTRLEWATLAAVLDRLFVIVFVVIDIVSLAVFHPRKTA